MEKKFNFYDGKIYFNSIQFFMFPLNSLILILNKIISTEKDPINLFKNSTKIDSEIILSKSKKKLPLIQKLNNSLELINSFGIGEFKLKRYSSDEFIFICEKSILSLTYFNIFKKTPNLFLEELNASFILNILELLTNRTTTHNLKKVNNILILKIKLTKHKIENFNSSINYFNETKGGINIFLKKFIINKNMYIKGGTLRVWKTFATIIPFFTLLEILNILDFKKYNLFFEELGKIQAKSAVEIQKNYFGLKDNFKVFNQVKEQSELLGGGVVKFNLENHIFHFQNNLNDYKFKFNNFKLLNLYFSNLVTGAFEFSFQKSIKLKKINDYKFKLEIISKHRILTKTEIETQRVLNVKTLFITSLQ